MKLIPFGIADFINCFGFIGWLLVRCGEGKKEEIIRKRCSLKNH